jgi:hypothetical protein
MPTPRDIEQELLARDHWLLAIGVFIAMLIVWLTLNNPSPEEKEMSKACFTICKQVVNEEFEDKKPHWGLRTEYLLALQRCMEECEEEVDENSDQSLDP